jgi:hypothetical protein
MLAQVMQFDGPRSPELLAAADRASRDRLGPVMQGHPKMREELIAFLVLRQEDGTERDVLIVRSAEGLKLARDLVTSSELLPGEDPALLPGPDRMDVFEVVEVVGSLSDFQGRAFDGAEGVRS